MRKRMLAIYLVLTCITLILSHSFVHRMVTDLYLENERQQLDHAAVLFASQNKSLSLKELIPKAHAYARDLEIRITLVSTEEASLGQVILDTEADAEDMVNHALREEIREALAAGEGSAVRQSATTQTTYLYTSYADQVLADQEVVLRLAKPIHNLTFISAKLRQTYLFLGIVLILGGMLVFGLLTSSVLRPLHDLSRRIRNMENKSAVTLLPKYEDPQVDQLADSFNKLVVLLSENVDRLRQNNQELKNIFENVKSGLLMLDRKGYIRVINQPAKDLLQIREGDSQHHLIYGIVRHPDLLEHLHKVTEDLERQEFEISWDNEMIYQIQLSPLEKENDPEEIIGILMVVEDVTDLRNVDNMRKDFVANVSHELKTPLTTIRGFVETLLNDDLSNPEIIRKFLGIIDTEADRLQTMIFQLLYLSKLDSKIQENDVTTIPIASFMDQFLYTMADQMAAKDMVVAYELIPEGLTYRGSENLLHQILLNLVENALSYSQGTRIDIRFSQKPNGLLLEVADDGVGIAKKEQSRIFERFYRVEKSRAQSKGGTGLGLAIVKHLVGNVGGQIKLQSDLGQGTRFIILLPHSYDPHA